MEKNFLAIDLGAESGRAILGRVRSGTLGLEEIHRFPNEPVEYGGSLHWDVARLWWEIRQALQICRDKALAGVAVDTWGVDYALLGENGQLLENPFHYRDGRTAGMMDAVFRVVPADEVYAATGIQFMPINTLYQLYAAKLTSPRLLDATDRLVTIPDLFHFWLSGNAVCEFTNASTTQMIDPRTRSWATALLENLGLPARLPGPIVEPGTVIGNVLSRVAPSLSKTPVIAPGAHDTASAVAAVSARGNTVFLSSGTWSLLGIELDAPVVTSEARRLNFTNEGGVCGTTRLLKNVMGLWLLQGCRRSWLAAGTAHEYRDLVRMAMRARGFQHLINPDDERFLRADDMVAAIDSYCADTDQAKPSSVGGYARAVLESLALKYRVVVREIERLTGSRIEQIRIIGGGSQNDLLNQFTADATGCRVLAGPVEATALGNIAMQMLAIGVVNSLAEARKLIDASYRTEVFEPYDTPQWDREAERFTQFCEVKVA
ncbi:MAG TPA: rhamnulokinase family protein [Bryobacteraceae bacterium]|nr:rhamnulokinase family protein [Bryobacteraceae bacterium]